MKVSLHGGRSKSLKHNDHNFTSDHIDENRKKDNVISYVKVDRKSVVKNSEEAIVSAYEFLYGKAIDAQNEKYKKKRQYSYIKTAADWAKAPRYAPREEIFQIGDKDDKVSRDLLIACYSDFLTWKKERFKHNYRRLTVSVHADEASNHIHDLSTWFYWENGIRKPGFAKALEQVGIPLPEPSKPASKTNNRMMTYTAICRQKWQEICKQHGLQIDVTPDPEAKHRSTERFKAEKQAEEILKQKQAELEVEYRQKKANLEAKYKQKGAMLEEACKKQYSENRELIELGRQYRAIKDAERISERIHGQADFDWQKEW